MFTNLSKRSPFLSSILFAVSIGFCSTSLAEEVYLSGDQIKKVLIGNTVEHESTITDSGYKVFYPSDGVLIGTAGLWGMFSDKGTWSVNGEIYCARWQSWQDNQHLCYRVKLNNHFIQWLSLDGETKSQDKLLQGNYYELK